MRKQLILNVCVFLALALVGCGNSNPMVGTWKLVLDEKIANSIPAGQKLDVTAEFKSDNTFSASMNMGERKSAISGTYKLEGKTLTMTATVEDGKPSSDKPETTTLSEDMKSFDMPGGMGKLVKQ